MAAKQGDSRFGGPIDLIENDDAFAILCSFRTPAGGGKQRLEELNIGA